MSYAEDETDVEGTVNGVTATTTGKRTMSLTDLPVPVVLLLCLIYICDLLKWGFLGKEVVLSRKPG